MLVFQVLIGDSRFFCSSLTKMEYDLCPSPQMSLVNLVSLFSGCRKQICPLFCRRLWTILCSVDHKIFISSALPVLCDKYYHIIPHKFWKGQSEPNGRDSITSQTQGTASEHSSENTCIRCAAKRRVREKAMLDLLYGCQLMSFDEYRQVFETKFYHLCFRSLTSRRLYKVNQLCKVFFFFEVCNAHQYRIVFLHFII